MNNNLLITLKVVLLLTCCFSILACGPSTSRMKKDITRLRSDFEDFKGLQAEHTTRLASLESQIRTISGKLEEIEFSSSRRIGRTPQTQDSWPAQYGNVPTPKQTGTSPLGIVPLEELSVDRALVGTMPNQVATLFADALNAIQGSRFRYALPKLEQIMNLSYPGEWNANVLFWIGVAYDGVKEDRKALNAYHQLVGQYPRHSRAAAALYREGLIFLQLGDKSTSRLTFKKVTTDYPKSTYATKARLQLKKL